MFICPFGSLLLNVFIEELGSLIALVFIDDVDSLVFIVFIAASDPLITPPCERVPDIPPDKVCVHSNRAMVSMPHTSQQ